jgi:hypothetical protein
MLRISPYIFDFVLNLIKDHPIFQNNSNKRIFGQPVRRH